MTIYKQTTWFKGFRMIELFPRVQYRHSRKRTEVQIAWILWGISLIWNKEGEK